MRYSNKFICALLLLTINIYIFSCICCAMQKRSRFLQKHVNSPEYSFVNEQTKNSENMFYLYNNPKKDNVQEIITCEAREDSSLLFWESSSE